MQYSLERWTEVKRESDPEGLLHLSPLGKDLIHIPTTSPQLRKTR